MEADHQGVMVYLFHDCGIDADHDLIITKFEALIQIAFGKLYQPGARKEIIRVLLRYTSSHFKREEACMRRFRYPGLADHMLAHAYMQNEFRKIRRIMSEDRPNLLSDVRLFRDMFLFHILTYDESFAEWLSTKGLRRPSRPDSGKAARARPYYLSHRPSAGSGHRLPLRRTRSYRSPIILPRSRRWVSS